MTATLTPAEVARLKVADFDQLNVELFRHLHAVAILQKRLEISRLRIEVDACTGDTEIMASSREHGARYEHMAVVHSSGEMIAIGIIPTPDNMVGVSDASETRL